MIEGRVLARHEIKDVWTIDRGLGCRVSDSPDPELLATEPDDIHVELLL